jgi:hypothetical protein
MEACHNNGVRTDCRLSNLRWDYPEANEADKLRHGTHQWGEQNPSAKLTRVDADDIRRLHDEGWSQRKIARLKGVSPSNVSFVLRGETWPTGLFE